MTGRDLRAGGSWTRLQRAKNDALWMLASLALAAVRPLPAAALRVLGRAIGVASHTLARGARRQALANVTLALPALDAPSRHALVRRCFETLGESLGETVALLRPGAGSPLAVADHARVLLDAAMREGRGVMFLSAHLGPWESVAASLAAAGVPIVVLARESYDPRFTRLYERLRAAHSVGILWRSRPGTAARILRTLRGGGVLGIPMDLRARVASCDAPFLGHPAPTAVGPARIALRTGAAVVVGTAAPGAGGILVTATRIPTSDLACDGDGSRELTERINAELSRRILALPHAWVWMHERWAGQPGV